MNYFLSQRDAFMNFLKELVEIETPSNSPEAVNKLAKFLEQRFREIGIQTKILDGTPDGDHLLLTKGEGTDKILFLCHMDTVWKEGTLQKMPFRIDNDKAYGPGIFDMKSGIAFLYFIFKAFIDLSEQPNKKILALLTSDEESGSETAKKYINEIAKDCQAVLVLEPAGEDGGIKTFRKGLGMAQVHFTGRAAHAGLDHQKGISAIKEMAALTLAVEKLTDYTKGTTVNVGVIKGGTVTNVVPEEAYAEIDFRFTELIEGKKVEKFIKEYSPSVQGVKVKVSGGIDRGPLVRTPDVVSLFEKAKLCANELGFDIKEISAGGVSDGNLTSAIGIPTLDGLGAVGDGAHAENEHIIIDETLKHLALVYKLIFRI